MIKFVGTDWINAVLPPAAMGPVVALIGLELAGTAAANGGIILTKTYKEYDFKLVGVFIITLLVVRLEIGEEEFFADLLFYHLKLRCFVVVELKTGKFYAE